MTANSISTPGLPASPKRQNRLLQALAENGLDGLALNPGPSLAYLTGLHFHLSERPVVALFAADKPVCLILPELELAKVEGLPFPVQLFPYGEDPEAWPQAFAAGTRAAGLENKLVGVEPGRLRFLELRLLEGAAPAARFSNGAAALASLRMFKDEGELAAMRKAVEIAQGALEATLPLIRLGMTERELAAELSLQLLRFGSDSEFPFTPIVSGGPNGANPHASPSQRPLQAGELLVIDWGAAYEGYFSDITRTFALGEVQAELQKIVRITAEANAAARAKAAPGVPAGEVDASARQVIEKAGYGRYFTHRTGHGLGLEGHEEPYIRAGNHQLLQPGMTFTIEPGIYLTARNGARIEDDMVITPTGAESLTDLPRELRVVG